MEIPKTKTSHSVFYDHVTYITFSVSVRKRQTACDGELDDQLRDINHFLFLKKMKHLIHRPEVNSRLSRAI